MDDQDTVIDGQRLRACRASLKATMLLLRSGCFVYESLLRGLLGPKDQPGLLTWSSPAKQKLRHIHPHPSAHSKPVIFARSILSLMLMAA
jgi:hypothetical protein